MHTTLLVVHILAAGTWFGASMVQFSINPKIRTYPTDVAVWWMRHVVSLGTRLYTPAAIVLLLTGVFLVTDSGVFEFSDAFVSIGFVMVIVGAAFGILIFGPRGRQAAAALESGDEEEVKRLTGSLAVFGVLDTVLLVVAVVAMVAKWGAAV